jgi:ABC-2 type transport system permease protein
MSRWRSVWLVAKREILERGRSRGFLFSVAFTTLLVIGSFVVPTLLFGDKDTKTIGVVQPAPPDLDTALTATAGRVDQKISVVPYDGADAAQAALGEGHVDAVLAVPADLSSAGTLHFAKEPDQAITQIASGAVVSLRVQQVLTDANVDQAALTAAQQVPTVQSLDPQTEADQARFLFANIGAVLILIGIFSFGFTVLTGVIEEKQSRVVEVVLSTVRPRDLLMGKVLGIGILGLVQLLVFVVAAMAAATLTRRFTLPETTPGAILMLTIWFVLGYALYSTALGFLGALASRLEEASNDPSGIVARIATFIPASAPFVVPLRAAFDAISPVEIVISIVITVAAIWVLFTIGARVYAGAVLQTGGRMKIRDAWRSAVG